MLIGVDFDNTIVSYEGVFHKIAIANGLIPAECETGKDEVRNYLRRVGREDDWTTLQGQVYGAGMDVPVPYDSVLTFFRRCRDVGIPTFVISHKTRYPYLGPHHDLHEAARGWLRRYGFYDPNQLGVGPDRIFFELTKETKLERIAALGCTHFIDDLPEFLAEPQFPRGVERILFDPTGQHHSVKEFVRPKHWDEITALLLAKPSGP
jgi:hypothetical protein